MQTQANDLIQMTAMEKFAIFTYDKINVQLKKNMDHTKRMRKACTWK